MEKEIKNSIVFDNDVPLEYRAKLIGYGDCGKCYLLDNGLVYKEFFPEVLDLLNKYSMKNFTCLDSELVAFPKTIVYKNEINDDNIMGYLYNYVDGDLLWDISDSESMNDIITASDKLEKEMVFLAKNGVYLFDVNSGGVIYTKTKEIKLIDTDLYKYWDCEDPYDIYKSSIKEWGLFIMLFLNTGFPFDNEILNEHYQKLLCGKIKPSYVIECILNELKKELNYDICSLGEYRNNLVHIRKKY